MSLPCRLGDWSKLQDCSKPLKDAGLRTAQGYGWRNPEDGASPRRVQARGRLA